MTIRIVDPVGEVAPVAHLAPRPMKSLAGARIGYVFNHHPAAVRVWRGLEDEIARRFAPPAVHRVDKPNVSVPAGRAELERLAAAADVALVGVGA